LAWVADLVVTPVALSFLERREQPLPISKSRPVTA
jgi:hypothetical protein